MVRKIDATKQAKKSKKSTESTLPTKTENIFQISAEEKNKNTINDNQLKEMAAERDQNLKKTGEENDSINLVHKICSLEQKIDQLQKKELDLTSSLAEKDRNIFELQQKLDSQKPRESSFRDLLKKQDKQIQDKEENARALKNQVGELEDQIKKYREKYEGDLESDCLPFDKTDKIYFENLVKYIRGIDANPQGINSRAKVVEKAIKKILGYEENCEKLKKICKYR